jgi:baseplate J-like protein
MPLLLPNLDDRRWSDLVDEGRAFIPRYAPSWTDFNVHDPGIMLMELHAWLTEASIYQLNQVTERNFWKFLSFIGYQPRGPFPARAQIVFGPITSGSSFELPAGVEFDAARPFGVVPFCMTRGVHLAATTLSAIQIDGGNGILVSYSRDLEDGLPIVAFGNNPGPGAALYLGFAALPSAVPVALWFWSAGPGNDARERDRIEKEAARQREACRPVVPDIDCPGGKRPPDPPVWHPPAHQSARIIWEAFTGAAGNPWIALQPVSMPARPATGQVTDDTRSLTLDGIVEVNLPTSIMQTVLGAEPTALFYLRARLVSGAWEAPVVLNDVRPNAVEVRQQAPLVGTYVIAPGTAVTGVPPLIGDMAYLQFHFAEQTIVSLTFLSTAAPGMPGFRLFAYTPPTASSAGSITLECAILGNGSGAPLQTFALPTAPVVDDLALYSHDGTSWTRWFQHEDFDAAHRDSPFFALDPVGGNVACGTGERGEVFPYGCALVAFGRSTLGHGGNVAANSITALASTTRNAALLSALAASDVAQLKSIAHNPHPASNGGDRETLAQTVARPAGIVHDHERLQGLAATAQQDTLDQIPSAKVLAIGARTQGVNTLDIERLARTIPGTRIARVRAWASRSALFPCVDAEGVVTVVIIPFVPEPQPQPSPGLLAAVRDYLDLRRMICMRLEVVGPSYVSIAVHAKVTVAVGVSASAIQSAIVAVLDAFLDPLQGGPRGLGWPFGRSVYRAEILEKMAAVPGVDFITGVTLVADAGQPQCGDIPICPTWLISPGTHLIEVSS